eukprot:6455021-Lingulodinium_polyedra.AAC.1
MMESDVNDLHHLANSFGRFVNRLAATVHTSTTNALNLTRRPHSRTTRGMMGRTRSGTLPGKATRDKPQGPK